MDLVHKDVTAVRLHVQGAYHLLIGLPDVKHQSFRSGNRSIADKIRIQDWEIILGLQIPAQVQSWQLIIVS
jgi:hypothetical protein